MSQPAEPMTTFTLDEWRAYKRAVRRRFPGTDAEFAAAWPEILKQWQIRQALGDDDDATRYARQLYRHF